MNICFVIMPFTSIFNSRYEDIFEPAIIACGLKPYRVDRDPTAVIIMDEIEKGIEQARVYLVEITTGNDNVMIELGIAIAKQKDMVILCSDERTAELPFDIRHRNIVKYKTKSKCDFEKLEVDIIRIISAILKK